ncbi:hypothetical protein AB0J47_39605 [Nocardia sp. NPDC049737]|uniref:hypothetical protein n=1 Tax=Nocardia sp. NPDC049737 TaxID=3154358 RepID=UPI0034352B52
MDQPLRLDVIFDDADRAAIDPLLTAIRETGVEPNPPGDEPSAVNAVLITPALIQHRAESELRAVTDRYQEVIPVSFLEGAAPIYKERSQTLVRQLGHLEAARRISLTVRHGGRTIVDWQRLADQAIKWRDEGAGLLRASEITAALALTHSETAKASPDRRTVLDYVGASSSAVSRRRRRWSGVLTSAAIMLTILLIVAVVQAFSARREQLAADLAANRADADRLSRVAMSLMDADPDLPSILAATAYNLAPTDLAHTAVAQSAAKTWPHVSVPIDYRPQTVTAARNAERFAVGEYDKPVVHIYQVHDDRTVVEASRIEVAASGVVAVKGYLSPNGTTLATTEADLGTIRIIDVDSAAANKPGWVTERDRLFGWIADHRLLIGRGDRLLSVDLDGNSETVLSVPEGQEVKDADISGNGRFIVAATTKSITRVDLRREMPERTASVEGAWDVAVNNTGTLAVAATNPLATTVEFRPETAEVNELQSFYASSVAFVTDQLALTGSRNGTFSFSPRDEHYGKWEQSATIRAHLDGSLRSAMIGSRQLVTIANDRYLRVWDISDDAGASSYISRSWQAGLAGVNAKTGVVVRPRLSARNQIRFATSHDVVITGRAGYATVLDAETLQEIEPPARRLRREAGKCSECAGIPGYFSGLFTELLPSRNGRFIAAVSSERTWISEHSPQSHYFDGPSQVVESPPLKLPRVTANGGEGVGAVSDDGTAVVVADDSVVAVISAADKSIVSHEYPQQRRPVGLFARGSSPAIAVTSDGYLRDSAGTETRLPLTNQTELAACEILSNTNYVCVTTQGQILRIEGRAVSEIGSVGDGLTPFAVRLSANEHRVAVIGQQGLSVVEIDSGIRSVTPNRIKDRMITDVAFSPDGNRLLAVRADGTVVAVAVVTQPTAPRALTAEESRLVGIPDRAR